MKKTTKKIVASVLAATMVMASGVVASAETVATPSISEAVASEDAKYVTVTVNAEGALETFDFGLVYDEKVVKPASYMDEDLGEEVLDITLSTKAEKVFKGRVITCEPMPGYNYLVMGGANEKAPVFNNEALYTVKFEVIDADASEAVFKVVKDSKANKDQINTMEAADTKTVTLKAAPATEAPTATPEAPTATPEAPTATPEAPEASAPATKAPEASAPATKAPEASAPATKAPVSGVVAKFLNKSVAELDKMLAAGEITAEEYTEVLEAKVEKAMITKEEANKAIDAQVKAGKISAELAKEAKAAIEKVKVATAAPTATAKATTTTKPASGKESPETGDAGVVLPVIALCGAAAAVVVASKKKVEE